MEKYGFLGKLPGVKVLKMEPLSRYSSFRIGGPADVLCIPGNEEGVEELLRTVGAEGLPSMTVGQGTNLLFGDQGLRGIVIKIGKGFERIQSSGTTLEASAGGRLTALSKFARDESLAGVEFASGIPGTVGGAIVTNAGAQGEEIGKLVRWVKGYAKTGRLCFLDRASLKFEYRRGTLPYPVVITSACLELRNGDKSEIRTKMEKFEKRRKETQPVKFPSAGSVFKNPEGAFAGKLVEECGLKGKVVGDAKISELHGNFIINLGGAHASDVMTLIELMRNEVMKRFGVELELEIEVVPESI